MASTGHINATLFGLYDGGTKIAYATDVQFEATSDMIETTTKDSGGDAEFIPGKRSFSGSIGILFREDAAHGYLDLFTKQQAGTAITAKWSTAVTGDKYEQGTVYITSISRGGGFESTFDASISFQGSGQITHGTET